MKLTWYANPDGMRLMIIKSRPAEMPVKLLWWQKIQDPPQLCGPFANYSVMQYLLNTKNKMHFDPIIVLNYFVAPNMAEPSTIGGAKEGSLDKRQCGHIAFL